MIASSTTTPIATTSPAKTITLMVVPVRSRTRIAAISESGIAIRLMNAVRHSNRNPQMTIATSSTPSSSAVVRLSMDCSMNVAGRKIVVSICRPGQPGPHLVHGLLNAPGHLHRVGAPELLDDQQ